MIRSILTMLLSLAVLTACGLQTEKYQGQTSRDDVENMGMNNDVTRENENPRSMNKVGKTWGLKQDRQMIKEAAQKLEGVEVKRVIIEANKVWVTVDVEGEKDMSKEELDEWKSQIKEAVYQAVPRYDIAVRIK
ncbi:YhcN/YlaJ family sporulation lipoprotein [Halobacillus litoralis]|uniref:YhcN/YlaJ family sporulation lipoprotein n=1 Tax=Halobacillus litoralis TaxID=45668 RepID=UPI001CFD62B1|nr:YhcN/YlaJ family sporulation lipoprotein [Halobacillus litoralis]